MNSNDVVIARVVKSNGVNDGTAFWSAQVITTVSGCIKVNSTLSVSTSSSSASCGVQLEAGSFLLSGKYTVDSNTLRVQSCNFNRLFSTLTKDEKLFAYNNLNNCTNACARGHMVNCFVRPCAISKCNISSAVCMDNYCNGCNAYWFSGSDRVCD